jgi:hypothetical protein
VRTRTEGHTKGQTEGRIQGRGASRRQSDPYPVQVLTSLHDPRLILLTQHMTSISAILLPYFTDANTAATQDSTSTNRNPAVRTHHTPSVLDSAYGSLAHHHTDSHVLYRTIPDVLRGEERTGKRGRERTGDVRELEDIRRGRKVEERKEEMRRERKRKEEKEGQGMFSETMGLTIGMG